MIRFIYNLFWPIGLLFFLPGYLVKMIRRGGYGEKFGQRLGVYDCELRVRLSKQKSTWLHAVSVGEVNVALKLASGKQERSGLDRSHVHTARLLVDHAPRVRGDQADANRAG
jgi:3-deoxy-D-manno-octulosonic-acid transferase